MKNISLIIFFLVFFGLVLYGQTTGQEEIDYLLFMPNSGNSFVDEKQAEIQLNNVAKYLMGLNRVYGKIYVYGYSAFATNDIDPVDLSRQRALFIINELQKRGISRDLFADPVGYGAVDLWGSNGTEEDKVQNRRVRILLDGIPITPEIIVEPVIKVESEPVAVKEKSDSKFSWKFLLPLLLIPLLLILFRLLKNKKEEKPVAVKAPVVVAAVAPVKKIVDIVDLEEEIRRRAYFQFLGHTEYSDMPGDWFKAIPKVCAEYEAKGYKTYIENGKWWAKKTI